MVKPALFGMLILVIGTSTVQAEECWSLLNTPDWSKIKAAIEQIKVCEALPEGPNRTRRFEATQIDICSAPEGFRVRSKVEVTCATSDAAFIRFSVKGAVTPDVTVDVGACRITSLDLDVSGDVGEYLSGLGLLQPVLRGWAQEQLNRICGKA
ncbi:hypothetical protein [Sinorhizobium fredii]|nr:hypothetical protein [Sinorhizobium fredii]